MIVYIKARFSGRRIQKNILDFFKAYHGVKLYIGGDDLRAMGLPPGPGYQKVLDKVLDAKLDGKLKCREDELAMARGLINKKAIIG